MKVLAGVFRTCLPTGIPLSFTPSVLSAANSVCCTDCDFGGFFVSTDTWREERHVDLEAEEGYLHVPEFTRFLN